MFTERMLRLLALLLRSGATLPWRPTTPQVNLQLSVGAATAIVTVSGVPPPLNASSAEVQGDAEAGKCRSFLIFGPSRMGGGFDAEASCM
jgi:hypothetical protein